ncbi:MAG: glycosyltransferase family 2 protein [Nitrospirota bacterium]|nr:glycosyltransferase family 2 protein [Nitrospirota bacterium]
MREKNSIGVVIPCFRVAAHIQGVIAGIGPEVSRIYVVDDCCPENTGDLVETRVTDPRVRVVRHEANKGVGGAVITGYRQAVTDGIDVVVKLDGDGQMDPKLIPRFVWPLLSGDADYTKGNRFYHPEDVSSMPKVRLFGNSGLSALAKFSTGYWNLLDPTNGYTAIHTRVVRELPLDKLSERYFFETDMLFRLNTIGAVVLDIPMTAVYGDEESNLKVRSAAVEFLWKNLRICIKRILYNYFLRDTSLATFELVGGLGLFLFGITFGAFSWMASIHTGIPATSGTVMLSALPTILGFQLLLNFLGYDAANVPRVPLIKRVREQEDLPAHEPSGELKATPAAPRRRAGA